MTADDITPSWEPILTTLAAIASLLIVWWAAETFMSDTPSPATPSPMLTVNPAERSPDASRGFERVPLPTLAARHGHPPTTPTAATGTGKVTAAVVGTTLSPVMRCIRWNESRGNYRAVEASGHYGAWQLASEYSDTWATKYGVPQYANLTADQWPAWAQDQVAVGLFDDWPGAWSTYAGCS